MCLIVDVLYDSCACISSETVCIQKKAHESIRAPVKEYRDRACDTSSETSRLLAEELERRLERVGWKVGGARMTETERRLRGLGLWKTLL